jgi:hypothetical protein
VNHGIVSYCDNCLVETPSHKLAYLDLGGHLDTRGVFAPRWVEACPKCVPMLEARGFMVGAAS